MAPSGGEAAADELGENRQEANRMEMELRDIEDGRIERQIEIGRAHV